MKNYDHCLELVSIIGCKGATRSALEKCVHGFFTDKFFSMRSRK